MKNPRNALLMAGLWIFAVLLCAAVLVLMVMRGPAVIP